MKHTYYEGIDKKDNKFSGFLVNDYGCAMMFGGVDIATLKRLARTYGYSDASYFTENAINPVVVFEWED